MYMVTSSKLRISFRPNTTTTSYSKPTTQKTISSSKIRSSVKSNTTNVNTKGLDLFAQVSGNSIVPVKPTYVSLGEDLVSNNEQKRIKALLDLQKLQKEKATLRSSSSAKDPYDYVPVRQQNRFEELFNNIFGTKDRIQLADAQRNSTILDQQITNRQKEQELAKEADKVPQPNFIDSLSDSFNSFGSTAGKLLIPALLVVGGIFLFPPLLRSFGKSLGKSFR